MVMTPVAARTRRPWTTPSWLRRVQAPAVVPILVLLPLLSACGQGGTPGAAPDVTATRLPTAPTTGDGMDPSTSPDPSVLPSTSPTGTPGTPSATGLPGASPPATVAALPADPASADLVLVPGTTGSRQPPVTLTCDWSGGTTGGTHPQPAQACADLLAAVQAGNPFAPVPPDAMCTMQYGGDAVVEVTGAVLAADGSPVDVAATFTLVDGCEISRFEAMGAVLAPFRGDV